MESVIVIPARYGSTRFPGKALAPIRGYSLLYRTWSIARAIGSVSQVVVATDDQRIFDEVTRFGGNAAMTSKTCRNGTERISEVVQGMPKLPDVVLNLQGDAVLTPPWVLEGLIRCMQQNEEVLLATPAQAMSADQIDQLRRSKASGQAGGTLVTIRENGDALYFSKSVIPYCSPGAEYDMPVYRHIGLYAYRTHCLQQIVSLSPSPLEDVEQLEQLRALENGIPIRVVPVDYQGRTHWGVDSPEDVTVVEEIIDREGELVPLGEGLE